MTGRDRERAEDVAREVRAAGDGRVDPFVASLSSQSENARRNWAPAARGPDFYSYSNWSDRAGPGPECVTNPTGLGLTVTVSFFDFLPAEHRHPGSLSDHLVCFLLIGQASIRIRSMGLLTWSAST